MAREIDRLMYLYTPTCFKCPKVHDVVVDVANELNLPLEEVNANEMSEDLRNKMLDNQIYLNAVPSLILKKNGLMKLISHGRVIDRDELLEIILKKLDAREKDHEEAIDKIDVDKGLESLDVLARQLPTVRTTNGDIVKFDVYRIHESLKKEGKIDEETAFQVTFSVVQRIMSYRIQWLSGPAIREMCNSVLAEMGLIEARKKYTRLGMALADYKKFFADVDKENANQYKNPESIHSWAGDKISSEYALLNLMSEEEATAHLFGDLHVHMLRYFDLRPFCCEWDLRIILSRGLPPVGWAHSAVSKPASKPMVAVLHAAKWLGIVQGEFAGGQGFDNFNVFLAPYVVGLSDDELDQLAQCFLFESNQIYAARGAQVPFTSISILPTVPKSLKNVPATSFKGKTSGTYGDYEEETNRLGKAFARMYFNGDGVGKMFNFPKFEVKITKDWIDKYEDFYRLVNKTTKKFGQPYYLNQACGWMSDEVHSQCCRIILDQAKINQSDKDLFDWGKYYINMGSLQSVSINLPRRGFLSKGNDDAFYETLGEKMELARDILLKKLAIIKKRLNNNVIPLCSGYITNPNGVTSQMLDFRRQSLSIGIVGLNECVKGITGEELHESVESFELGRDILNYMVDKCKQFTEDSGIRFSAWEQPAESTANRFALSDMKHYPNLARPLGEGRGVYYTNSNHINYGANISLDERIRLQAEYHPIVQGGVITHAFLGDANCDEDALWALTKNIALRTKTGYFAFTFNFTQCLNPKCGIFIKGFHDICPSCKSVGEFLEWWTRVTGYYARKKRFNKGKICEVNDRKTYSVSTVPIAM